MKALSMYVTLNEQRAGILKVIEERGRVSKVNNDVVLNKVTTIERYVNCVKVVCNGNSKNL